MSDAEYKTELPELGKYMDEYGRVLENAARFNMQSAVWSGNVLIAIDSGYDIPKVTVDIAKLMIENGCTFKSTQVAAVQQFTIPADPKAAEIMWNQSFAFIEKCSIAERSSGRRIEDEPLAFAIDLSDCVGSITKKDLHDRLQTLLDIKGSFIYIFRVPYLEEKVLRKVEAVLSDIFPIRTVAVKPLSDNQLVKYLRHRLEQNNVELADDADSMMKKLIEFEKSDGRFDGLQTMNKLADNIIYVKLSKITKETKVSISRNELAKIYSELRKNEKDPEVVLEQLNGSAEPAKEKKVGF